MGQDIRSKESALGPLLGSFSFARYQSYRDTRLRVDMKRLIGELFTRSPSGAKPFSLMSSMKALPVAIPYLTAPIHTQ